MKYYKLINIAGWECYKENEIYPFKNSFDYDLRAYPEDWEEVTEKEYLEQEKMKTIEFTLPEKWCVRGIKTNGNCLRIEDPELFKTIQNSNFPFKDNQYGFYVNCYYYPNQNDKLIHLYEIPKDYTEITFEQFKRYVLKSNDVNDKKVVGYKLTKPEYKNAVKQLLNEQWFDDNFDNNFKKHGWNFGNSSNEHIDENNHVTVKDLKQAGVLDLWFEPVYELQYKVDDWVLLSSNAGGYGARPCEISNKILQITKINLDDRPECGGRYYFGDDIRTVGKEIVRKATPEEIKQAIRPKSPVITINNYEAEYFDTHVKFGCVRIDKRDIDNLYFVLKTWNANHSTKVIEKIKIGNGEFTSKQILEIGEYYLKNNNERLES